MKFSQRRWAYAIVGFLKRAEGVDTFDYNTRFTPLAAEM
jgi:hypothetical protein